LLTPGNLNNGERLNYAFGLFVGRYKGLPIVDHGGALAGYRADLIRFPDQRFSVACMCNFASANPGNFVRQVADIYLGDQLKLDESEEGAKKHAGEKDGIAGTVTLSPEQLAVRAGVYWNSASEEAMRLYVDGGKLMLAADQGITLTPVTEDHFKVAGEQVDFFFDRPNSGGPPKLREVAADGKPAVYEAVSPKALSPAEMNEFAGTYYSQELDARYVLLVQEGKLILRRKRSRDIVLYSMLAYMLMNEDLGTLTFKRDSQNRVAGFSLNAGRVKHISFARESQGSSNHR
jgi:hypothetical protein